MSHFASSSRAAEKEAAMDRIQLAFETLSWLAGWLILPAWLAIRGVGPVAFLAYGLGAGLLLSLGVAADRNDRFHDRDHMIWFAAISCVAILIIGGGVFMLVNGIAWVAGR
jgi:hypothetical protein